MQLLTNLGKTQIQYFSQALMIAIVVRHSFIKEYIDELKILFQLDPLIMPALVYICPKDDLPLLCEYVPLSLFIGNISYKLTTMETLNKEGVLLL